MEVHCFYPSSYLILSCSSLLNEHFVSVACCKSKVIKTDDASSKNICIGCVVVHICSILREARTGKQSDLIHKSRRKPMLEVSTVTRYMLYMLYGPFACVAGKLPFQR